MPRRLSGLVLALAAAPLVVQAQVAPVTAVSATVETTAVNATQAGPTGATQAATMATNIGWTNSALDLTRPRALSTTARLTNVSIRGYAGDASTPLVAGANIAGDTTLPMLVRGIGPGLRQFGVANNLRDPSIAVYRGNAVATRTTSFSKDLPAVSAYVGAFPLFDGSATGTGTDAALVGNVAPGGVTAQCTSASNGSGIALLELYDATATASATSPHFTNFSARAKVDAGDGLAVMGFVVVGDGDITLLLRGVGPTLSQFGVASPLADPTIELYSGTTRIGSNDNWRSGTASVAVNVQAAARLAGAFDLTSDNDAAMLVTLHPGSYTLHVKSAAAGQTGIALAEVYEVHGTPAFDAAAATNATGLDLYRQLASTRSGQNVIVSPYSIESALALAYAGAVDTTRTQMARVLSLPADNSVLQAAFADLRTGLDQVATQSVAVAQSRSASTGKPVDPIEWHAANRLFGQQGYPFRSAFLTLMSDGFAAPLQLLDFKSNPDAGRVVINNWVADQTKQKILNLIPSGALDEFTRLVLVNALYLKAAWDTPFDKAQTTNRPFHPTPATSRDVPTMLQTTTTGYITGDGMTVVTLNYLGTGLQFLVILPDAGQTTETIAAKLTSDQFARWANLGSTSARQVTLYLPKFTVHGGTVPLGAALQSLGMLAPFDLPRASANFNDIAPRQPDDYLKISEVFHQTYVALDEQGTEAAAATAVVMVSVTSITNQPPPVVVQVDRPFLFAIQHRASGTCLFLGRIADPSAN